MTATKMVFFTAGITMKQAGTNLGWKLSYKGKTVLEGELVSEGKDICIEAEIRKFIHGQPRHLSYMNLQ